ncbi:MAG: hypothetical protein R6W94_11735 [Spirochaetia bacterium]
MLEISFEFAAAYEGCVVGYVAVEFETPPEFTDDLEAEIARRERDFVSHYGRSSRAELKALPVLSDYVRHFKRFKKTYHVLLQLASAAEGKPIPRVSPLVSIMLTSELSTLVLSSGHDLDVVRAPLTFRPGSSDREIELLGGRSQALKDGDITLCDGDTTLAAVVYGQSVHGMIDDATTRAILVAYGVPGVDATALRAHLDDMVMLAGLTGGRPVITGPQLISVGE